MFAQEETVDVLIEAQDIEGMWLVSREQVVM